MSPFDRRLESQALALLEEALEHPEADRNAWIEARTSDHSELRERTLALLAAVALTSGLRTGGAGEADDVGEAPERIGAYRITDLLGQGGMGAVYRAERDVGDFQRTVAIKIIRPGALSDALIERFNRERQTLANLIHPHVARLYDGGQTDDGQPYIVMEFVAGRPILEWAAQHAAPLRRRIELFLQACDGVRFAHQNLVVHRDLTPSNVLVTTQGEVKLIDFGIARPPEMDVAIAREGVAGDLSLTPGYAAPERTTGAATSTLMDVYSLGELLRALTADQPADRDLQVIADKAAARDPQARYASVDTLIDDVERWRDGRAVAARGPDRLYATGRFVRRHWRAVASASAAVAALVIALVVTLTAYAAADRAQAAEARRFAELRSLAGYMIFQLNGELRRTAGNTRARAQIAERAQRYLTSLAAGAREDQALREETARGLIALAYVQGVPGQPNLGQRERARANLNTALSMIGPEALNDWLAGQAGLALMEMHVDTRTDAAQARVDRMQATLDAAPVAARDAAVEGRRRMRHAQVDLAAQRADPAAVARYADLLTREADALPPALRNAQAAELDRAWADQYRGMGGYLGDRFPEAVAAANRADARLVRLDAAVPNDPQVLYARAWTGYVGFTAAESLASGGPDSLRFLGIAGAAISSLLRLEENDLSLLNFAGQIGGARAQSLSARGQHADAMAEQRRVIAHFSNAARTDATPGRLNRLAMAQATLGRIAFNARDRASACAAYMEASRLMEQLGAAGTLTPSVGGYRALSARNVGRCGRGEAVTTFETEMAAAG